MSGPHAVQAATRAAEDRRRRQLNASKRHRPRKPIRDQFLAFHDANPHVYAQLVKLARQARARGMAKYGIGALVEVLRWHVMMAKGDGQQYKVQNNYRSHYARLIMDQEADLAGFFDTRELRSL